MPSFIGRNFRFVLQCETDVVQTIEQAMAYKIVDGELRAKALIVMYLALLQVDGELVIFYLAGAPHHFSSFILAQEHGEETIFRAVVGEDVGEGRGNDGAESEIRQRPDRMLTRGTAAKVLSSDQNARSCVARLVQYKTRVLLSIGGETPVIKQELTKARALNPLQKLLGNDLVGVDIYAVERSYATAVGTKWFH